MRIVSLYAENFKRLRVVEIIPKGNLVQITGANGSGKSSVLDAFYVAIAGKGAAPIQPVRQGEESARIRVDLGELIVTRTFDAAGRTSLTVTTPDGAKYGSPQTMLDALLGSTTFDPLAFSRMAPREQRDTLARLAGLATMLADLDAAHKLDYDERAAVNRVAKQTAAQLAALPVVEPTEPVVLSELVTALREAQHHNAQVERERSRREEQARAIAADLAKATTLREQARRLLAEADALDTRTAAAKDEFERLPAIAPLADVSEIERQFAAAEATNARARQYAEREKLAAVLREHETKADAITKAMADRETERRRVIEAAAFPVEGLGLTEDGVTYKGLPLAQASSAEQLRVSVAIAMAQNPTLRVLRIQDGSLLDEHSLAMLAEMAEVHDFSCWIERVDTSGSVGFVMEDGTVREASAEEATPNRRPVAAGV